MKRHRSRFRSKTRRLRKPLIGLVVIAAFSLFILLFAKDANAPSNKEQPENTQNTGQASDFDKQAHSIHDPASIWIVASKVRPLSPLTYAPSDLVVPDVSLRYSNGHSEMRMRQEAATALQKMVAAAKAEGINLLLASGYRSYQLQVSVYNAKVQKLGQAGADKVSARPGTSEHQTGFAVDLGSTSRKCEIETCFADTAEGKWLADNSYKYGFVLRYPEGAYDITGYEFEPWHFRYVGEDLSQEMRTQNIQTMEEFFDIVPDEQPY